MCDIVVSVVLRNAREKEADFIARMLVRTVGEKNAQDETAKNQTNDARRLGSDVHISTFDVSLFFSELDRPNAPAETRGGRYTIWLLEFAVSVK